MGDCFPYILPLLPYRCTAGPHRPPEAWGRVAIVTPVATLLNIRKSGAIGEKKEANVVNEKEAGAIHVEGEVDAVDGEKEAGGIDVDVEKRD